MRIVILDRRRVNRKYVLLRNPNKAQIRVRKRRAGLCSRSPILSERIKGHTVAEIAEGL